MREAPLLLLLGATGDKLSQVLTFDYDCAVSDVKNVIWCLCFARLTKQNF
jgi:hypothetical protein